MVLSTIVVVHAQKASGGSLGMRQMMMYVWMRQTRLVHRLYIVYSLYSLCALGRGGEGRGGGRGNKAMFGQCLVSVVHRTLTHNHPGWGGSNSG